MTAPAPPLLQVEALEIAHGTGTARTTLLHGVAIEIAYGEILGLVGESGAGKSLLGAAIIGLLPSGVRVVAGRISLAGERLDGRNARAWRAIRGRRIGLVVQDPSTALDPIRTLGAQLAETITAHLPLQGRSVVERAATLLDAVGLSEPLQRLQTFPHQLSGGQLQRAVLALALAGEPQLLIADEPTTALDVVTQAQILLLLRRLCKERGTAMLLISHDLAVVAALADRVAVIYAGRIVEEAPTPELLTNARHPYTRGLLAATATLATLPGAITPIPGSMPRAWELPAGCAFAPRCAHAFARCRAPPSPPPAVGCHGRAACWLAAPAGRGVDPSDGPRST